MPARRVRALVRQTSLVCVCVSMVHQSMSICLDMPCLCVFACARHILEHTLPRPPSHPGTLSQIQHDGGLRTRTRASQRFPCRHICTRAYTNYAMYARHEWFAREGHSMSHRDITHAEVTPAHATPPMHPTMSVARSSSRYETDRSHPQSTTQPQPRIQELTRTMCCPTLLNNAKQVACRQQQTTRAT
jgi:hypothetical protein